LTIDRRAQPGPKIDAVMKVLDEVEMVVDARDPRTTVARGGEAGAVAVTRTPPRAVPVEPRTVMR
jgi:hypothetical protein